MVTTDGLVERTKFELTSRPSVIPLVGQGRKTSGHVGKGKALICNIPSRQPIECPGKPTVWANGSELNFNRGFDFPTLSGWRHKNLRPHYDALPISSGRLPPPALHRSFRRLLSFQFDTSKCVLSSASSSLE